MTDDRTRSKNLALITGALEDLDDRIQPLGGTASPGPLDVTDPDQMAHLAGSIAARGGGVDLWAHTAIHAAPLCPAGHIDARALGNAVAVNVTAEAGLLNVMEPLLLRARGHGPVLRR